MCKLVLIYQKQTCSDLRITGLFEGFLDIVKVNWETAAYKNDPALMLNGKFKKLRLGLKKWSRNFSNLSKIISKCNYTLALIDGLEDQRSLSTVEKNFQRILPSHT
jgi:hypothetical protein